MLRIMTRAGFIALALSAATLMALVLHSNPPAAHADPLFEGARMDQATRTLFHLSLSELSLGEYALAMVQAHSPASWMIAKDVHEARAHVNFSRWSSYGTEQQENLTRIGAVVRTGRMPLPRYALLHREAVLTVPDRQEIYEWSRVEKKRL